MHARRSMALGIAALILWLGWGPSSLAQRGGGSRGGGGGGGMSRGGGGGGRGVSMGGISRGGASMGSISRGGSSMGGISRAGGLPRGGGFPNGGANVSPGRSNITANSFSGRAGGASWNRTGSSGSIASNTTNGWNRSTNGLTAAGSFNRWNGGAGNVARTGNFSTAHATAANNWHNNGSWNNHNNGSWNNHNGGSWNNHNHNGSWNGHHDGHGHDDHHHHGSWGWGAPWGWGLALSLGWGWPGAWGYGSYPYAASYSEIYPSYYSESVTAPVVVQSDPNVAPVPPVDTVEPTTAQAAQEANPSAALSYFNEAVDAFRTGDYRAAIRSAAHAGVEDPKNARPHELASLALFANGEYRGAAMEAHAALALGPAGNWDTMVGYYGNVSEPFTSQLRSLEQYATQNPSAGEAHFLLGYLYQGMGYSEQAQRRFAKAAELSPKDGLANSLAGNSNDGAATSGGATTAPVIKPAPRTVPPNPKPVLPQPR